MSLLFSKNKTQNEAFYCQRGAIFEVPLKCWLEREAEDTISVIHLNPIFFKSNISPPDDLWSSATIWLMHFLIFLPCTWAPLACHHFSWLVVLQTCRNAGMQQFWLLKLLWYWYTCLPVLKRRQGGGWGNGGGYYQLLGLLMENQWACWACEWETDLGSDQSSRCDLRVGWGGGMRGCSVGPATWKVPPALRAS